MSRWVGEGSLPATAHSPLIGQIIELGLPFDGVFPKGETNTDDGEKSCWILWEDDEEFHQPLIFLSTHSLTILNISVLLGQWRLDSGPRPPFIFILPSRVTDIYFWGMCLAGNYKKRHSCSVWSPSLWLPV